MLILRNKRYSSLKRNIITTIIPTLALGGLGYVGGGIKGKEEIGKEKREINKFLGNYKNLRDEEKKYINRAKKYVIDPKEREYLKNGLRKLDERKEESEKRLKELDSNYNKLIKKAKLKGGRNGLITGLGIGLGLNGLNKLTTRRLK